MVSALKVEIFLERNAQKGKRMKGKWEEGEVEVEGGVEERGRSPAT